MIATLLSSCGVQSANHANDVRVVKVATVREVNYVDRDFAGMSTADDATMLAFKLSGQVASACNNHHKMIITVIVFQRINSVLPNKLMPNYRKAGWSNIKLPNKFKPNCRKISFHLTE